MGFLLIEISESAAVNSRPQQCNLEENPFSLANNPFFQHLYIQTDGDGTFAIRRHQECQLRLNPRVIGLAAPGRFFSQAPHTAGCFLNAEWFHFQGF